MNAAVIAMTHVYGRGGGWYWLGVWLWHRIGWWTLAVMPVIVTGMGFLAAVFRRGDE